MIARLSLSPVGAFDRWAVGAQLTARRNAMVAATQPRPRRAERLEVEEYLAARCAPAPLRRAVGRR